MPKERRAVERHRYSTCSSSSCHDKQFSSANASDSAEILKEWEDARCPVCMEHPHNAVLLVCSAYDKGCRPYMCDTSYRHSNCLDQFRKAFGGASSSVSREYSSPRNVSGPANVEQSESVQYQGGTIQAPHALLPCSGQEYPKLSCPLCRGKVRGWIVVDSARRFMNSKTRTCSRESCLFSGTYPDLRKHARREHPYARPSEVDEYRQQNWRRLERQRDLGDVLSTIHSAFTEERGVLDNEDFFPVIRDEGDWFTVYFLIRVFGSPGSFSAPTRSRGMPRSRRRLSLWGESFDGGTSMGREGDGTDDVVEGVSGSWRRRQRRRLTTPDSDEQ